MAVGGICADDPRAVCPGSEPVIRLRLRGPHGAEVEVVALVDTGFSEFLLLPSRCVEDLGLAELPDADTLRLADDTEATFRLYECAVVWADEERAVVVHAAEASPLVGMALLWQHRLTVDVEINGALTIEPLM